MKTVCNGDTANTAKTAKFKKVIFLRITSLLCQRTPK